MMTDFVTWVNDVTARLEAELWEDATPIVVCRSRRTGACTYTGPFDDIPSALRYAERMQSELNEDGEDPVTVDIVPMWGPENSETEKEDGA